MSELVLKVEDVSKTYPGVRALDNFSLDCLAGEVHAILGENGSGKSTLMKIASGTVAPDGGRVDIAGQRLTASDARLAHQLGLATVYQDDSLVRELSIAQNLYLGTPQGEVAFSQMNAWAQEQLDTYGLDVAATTMVGDLTPANRQFVEIVKALLSRPKVLLLDEPTSTLDLDGVNKLMAIIRDLTEQGTGILYVSHRLPEILDIANRVSILRDGVHRGTFPVTPDLSEEQLISLMIGRDLESEYPPKPEWDLGEPILSVRGLDGHDFHDLDFDAYRGEILGFAGAEGNGQREALRALVGLEESDAGTVTLKGAPVDIGSPRGALQGGILFLSADRAGEAIFPELGVRKNMMLTRLRDTLKGSVLSSRQEAEMAGDMVADFDVRTATLDTPIIGLSGGNQQKAALARSFRTGARAILIDEPTQGVDAGARFDIYKAIRENIRDDGVCIVNSSDGQELAGICDRVLVFSRGRIVAELTGDQVTEEQIVASFLTTRDAKSARAEAGEQSGAGRFFRSLLGGSVNWWVPLVFLAFLTLVVGGYAASQSDVFLKQINIRHILLAAAPAVMVAIAQMHVLLVRGLDVSVGSMMSLTVVAASFLIAFQAPIPMVLLGTLACLAIGLVVGTINGVMVRYANINAIITTIAMLSVLQGIALIGRPTPGGLISQDFTEFLRTRVGFVPISFFALLAFAGLSDWWLHRTRSGLEAKAVGFREEAARRNGVRVDRVQIRAYIFAALLATVAGFFLGSEVGVGHPTVGQNFALASIAAAVLGGAALTGGRGSFIGALFGALFFTLTINVISILGLSASVGVIASGIMTLLAIFLYTGLGEVERVLKSFRRPPAAKPAPAE